MKTKKIIEIIIVSAITLSAIGLLTSKIVLNGNKLNNNIFLNESTSSTETSTTNESTSSTESTSSVDEAIEYDANNITAINRDTTNDWISSLEIPGSGMTSIRNDLLDSGTYSYIRNDLEFINGEVTRRDLAKTTTTTEHGDIILSLDYDSISKHTIDYNVIINEDSESQSLVFKNITSEQNPLEVGSLIIMNKAYTEKLWCGRPSNLSDMLFNSIYFSENFVGIDVFSDSTFYYFYISESYGAESMFINVSVRAFEELFLEEDFSYFYDTMMPCYDIDQNIQIYKMEKIEAEELSYHSIVIPE